MTLIDEFRTGEVSLPSAEADDIPSCCFTCVYLLYKEFSVGEGDGLFYYYCAYNLAERINQALPACSP